MGSILWKRLNSEVGCSEDLLFNRVTMLKALTRRAQFTKVQKARHLSGNVKSRLASLRAVMAKTPEKIDA